MDQIKFDKAKADTMLAEEHLKSIATFKSKGFPDSDRFTLNDYKNTIYYSNYTRISGTVFLSKDVSDIPLKLMNLAKKIEENVELFCQLELLLRKIPVDDTRRIDLKLITQNFLYHSTSRTSKEAICTPRQIVFDSNTPLVVLGFVCQVLLAHMPRVVIECTKETAPVASLFTDLCHQVGFEAKVLLAILPEAIDAIPTTVTWDNKKMTEFLSCIGIVSGKSDIDSAVDSFLNACGRYPWAIKKIFVQENAVEKFTRTMTWKEERQMVITHTKNKSELDRDISYSFGDKTFVLNTGREKIDHSGNVIVLEAYRTVKELLSLLENEKSLAVSLWCSDVAETNELAHNIDASIVWVNDFANFEGPPRCSQAFFSIIDLYYSTEDIEYQPGMAELVKLRESWLELSISKRKDIVRNALAKIDKNQSKRIIYNLENVTVEMDSFVYVTKNTITTGIELQPQVMLPSSIYDDDLKLSIISYIIKGGAILLHITPRQLVYKSRRICYMFYENLRSLGGPVLILQTECKDGDTSVIIHPINRIKVIWTNFGTIFAN